MLIRIIHTNSQALQVLYILSEVRNGTVEIIHPQSEVTHTTIFSPDKEDIKGLDYTLVGTERIYILDITDKD